MPKINDRQKILGAALLQIAKHPNFTSINRANLLNDNQRSGFVVHDDDDNKIGVYLRFCMQPSPPYTEYKFNFARQAKDDLQKLNDICDKTFLALICEQDKEICCLPYDDFYRMMKVQSTVNMILKSKGGFCVYVNARGKKSVKHSGTATKVPRRDFPDRLFSEVN